MLVIRKSRKGKSDKIPTGIIKAAATHIAKSLKLFNKLSEDEITPEQCDETNITAKKKGTQLLNSFKLIRIIPNLYELFMMVLKTRLDRISIETHSTEQLSLIEIPQLLIREQINQIFVKIRECRIIINKLLIRDDITTSIMYCLIKEFIPNICSLEKIQIKMDRTGACIQYGRRKSLIAPTY